MDVSPGQKAAPERPVVAGQLVGQWRTVLIAGWVGVIAGFGAVAQAGRLAGISPWWIGPATNPRHIAVFVVPFLAPTITIVLAAAGSRFACHAGVLAALVSAAMALGDRDFPGIALVEVVVAGAGLLVTVACFAGRAVRPPADRPPAPVAEPREQPEAHPPR